MARTHLASGLSHIPSVRTRCSIVQKGLFAADLRAVASGDKTAPVWATLGPNLPFGHLSMNVCLALECGPSHRGPRARASDPKLTLRLFGARFGAVIFVAQIIVSIPPDNRHYPSQKSSSIQYIRTVSSALMPDSVEIRDGPCCHDRTLQGAGCAEVRKRLKHSGEIGKNSKNGM